MKPVKKSGPGFIKGLIGISIALSLSLLAFEWRSYFLYEKVKDIKVRIIEENSAPIQIEKEKVQQQVQKQNIQKSLSQEIKKIITDTKMVNPDEFIISEKGKDGGGIFRFDGSIGLPEDSVEGGTDLPQGITDLSDYPVYPGCEHCKTNDERFECMGAKLSAFVLSNFNLSYRCKEGVSYERIVVNFIIEKDGAITGVNIVKGNNDDCNRDAVKVIEKLPKMIPGKQNGQSVRTSFNAPILIQLD